MPDEQGPPRLIAIFGPTGVGKTGVAIALAERLREGGEDPVAIGCDAMQVYRGLEAVSGAPTPAEQAQLEHRLVGFLDPSEEFSAGRFAALAHGEIDAALEAGRRPILVGGTGLYLRAALSELDLRPPVPTEVREAVERELEERGAEALHAELEPAVRERVHPNDRRRITRAHELARAGIEPPQSSERLWTEDLRHPTLLAGLVVDRDLLAERIAGRVEAMAAAGARKQASRGDLSSTAAAMIGLEGFAAGDLERVRTEHLQFARRQTTWMRKMPGVHLIDRGARDDAEVAAELFALAVG